MATVSNGAATSVSNTPQAKDDYVTTAEDVGTKINVLANDSGGAAKSLYSISQGDPLAVAKTATSSLGATIYITSDGQVYYDPASATRIQALAQGETAVDTFVYEERLGNGTISTATVYVTVKGTNDGPILAADTATHAMTEIAGATSGSGTETASTTLTFTDRDLSDTHTVSYGAPSVTWTGGAHIPADTAAALASALTLTKMDSTGSGTGSVKVDFALADKLADFLGVHETLTVTYQITVRDSQGASSVQPVTLTLTGTNDDALITAATAGSDRGTVTEDGNVAAEGVLSFTDADLNDAHTVSVMPSGAALGTLTVNKTADLNGVGSVSWSYTVDSTKVQYLAEGETKVESFQILLSDGTSTVSKTVSITITGTNDAPVVTPASVGDSAGTATPLLQTDAGLATSGTLTVIDLDVVDQVSVAVSGVTHSGPTGSLTNAELLSYFHITPGTIVDGSHTSGQFTWTFNSGAQAFDFLAQSEVLELQYRITPDDGHAPTGTGDGVVTIRIQGTNDAAVIGGTATGAVTEDAVTTTSGQLTITDVDTGEAHFQAIAAGALTKTYGSFTFNETTGAWSYALDHAKADSLAKDQVVHDTLNVTSFDGTDTQLIDVTITGTNDGLTPNLVLNFDNISSGPVPDGYGGLNWNSNGSFYSGTADILNTGYGYGNGDNDSFVFNGWAGKYSSITKTNGGTFSVSGLDIADSTYAHFSDTPNDANTVQFVGMKNGAQTYSKLVSLSNDHFDHVDLDFSGIDQFQINVVGGQQSGLGVSNTGWWAIDNLGIII